MISGYSNLTLTEYTEYGFCFRQHPVLRLSGSSFPCKLKGVTLRFSVYISLAPKFSDNTRGLVLLSGSKEKKPASSLKTFYICLIVLALLGLAIALAMWLFQRAKR